MAIEIADLVGFWNMVHDDWEGRLVVNPTDRQGTETEDACAFSYWLINGTWTGGDGQTKSMRGTFQGRDVVRRTDEPCPESPHFVQFLIDFTNGEPPQVFEGYLFTHQKQRMAGYTWWRGVPFGWFAIKG